MVKAAIEAGRFADLIIERVLSELEVLPRAIFIAGSALRGEFREELDVCVLVPDDRSQRRRSFMGPLVLDTFIDSEIDVINAIRIGHRDHIVRMYAEGTIIFQEDSGAAEIQERCRTALQGRKPSNDDLAFRADASLADLFRKASRAEGAQRALLTALFVESGLRAWRYYHGEWDCDSASLIDRARSGAPEVVKLAEHLLESTTQSTLESLTAFRDLIVSARQRDPVRMTPRVASFGA